MVNLSPFSSSILAALLVPGKEMDLTIDGSSASFLRKIVEPVIFCARNSPLTVEPSFSVAFAVTTVLFVEAMVASSAAETAIAAEMKRVAIRCFIACSL